MRPLTLAPSVAAFHAALIAQAQRGGDLAQIALPTVPATPTDPMSAAFLTAGCLPLYRLLAAIQDYARRSQAPTETATIAPAGSGMTDAEYLAMLAQQSQGAP